MTLRVVGGDSAEPDPARTPEIGRLQAVARELGVGERVRFRDGGTKDELGRPEGVIEQVMPRETILTRWR